MKGKSQSTAPGVHHQQKHHRGTKTCLATTNVLDIIVRWHVRKKAIEGAKEAREPRDEKIRKITGLHANLKIIHQKKKSEKTVRTRVLGFGERLMTEELIH